MHVVLPLSFIAPAYTTESVVVSADEGRLIRHLESLAKVTGSTESPFAVAVRLQLKLEKSALSSASRVLVTKDADAVRVMLSEEDVRAQYPWDYKELCRRMVARYKDFKQDSRFHAIRKPLLTDARYAKARYLDPGNPKSPKKDFYNPNVLSVFDASYDKA